MRLSDLDENSTIWDYREFLLENGWGCQSDYTHTWLKALHPTNGQIFDVIINNQPIDHNELMLQISTLEYGDINFKLV